MLERNDQKVKQIWDYVVVIKKSAIDLYFFQVFYIDKNVRSPFILFVNLFWLDLMWTHCFKYKFNEFIKSLLIFIV